MRGDDDIFPASTGKTRKFHQESVIFHTFSGFFGP